MSLAERYDQTGEYTKNFESWFDEQNAVKPRPPIPQALLTSRIPSTWITTSTTTTTQRPATPRFVLRTLPPTARTPPPRVEVQDPPIFRTVPVTIRAPVDVPTPRPLTSPPTTRRTTTQAPETVRTNPPTPRPTIAPFTAPTTVATPPPTTEAAPQRFEPEEPKVVFEPPPIPTEIPTVFRTEPLVLITEPVSTPTPVIFRDFPLVIRTQPPVVAPVTQAPSRFPQRNDEAFIPQRPPIRPRPSTANFQPPQTVRSSFVPEQNRPVS